jgi:nucleolar protein 4
LTISDAELKAEAKYAVIHFWRQVKSGNRQGLEPEELDGKDNGVRVIIHQAKMLKGDRIDPTTKKPRSKGMGFVEFERHTDALACLRYLNLNPTAFTHTKSIDTKAPLPVAKAKKSVVVEFAIENKLVLKKRDERNKRKCDDDEAPRKKVKKSKESKEDGPASDHKKQKEDPKREKKSYKERMLLRKAKRASKKTGDKPKPVVEATPKMVSSQPVVPEVYYF